MDFTNCPIDSIRAYGGQNGNKIGILIDNQAYMLKFPAENRQQRKLISYRQDTISEHISCQIYKSLEIPVQETILGTYTMNSGVTKTVVACKDFVGLNERLYDFASLKNTVVESSKHGYGTELPDILQAIREQKRLNPQNIEKRFWDMFVVDTLVGNFDRHNGNWGFIVNLESREWRLAPVFDCGSSFLPTADDKTLSRCLIDEEFMNERIFVFPTSAITINGKKINMHQFLETSENEMLAKSICEIVPKINLEKIKQVVVESPYISDIKKEFINEYLKERKEKLLDPVLERFEKIKNKNQHRISFPKLNKTNSQELSR